MGPKLPRPVGLTALRTRAVMPFVLLALIASTIAACSMLQDRVTTAEAECYSLSRDNGILATEVEMLSDRLTDSYAEIGEMSLELTETRAALEREQADHLDTMKELTESRSSRGVSRSPSVSQSGNTPQAGSMSRGEVASLLRYWCDQYGVESTDWLVEKGCDIAWRESRYNPSAQNPTSSAAGLFQFLKAWGPLEDRLDPNWSCRVFVRTYVQGGESALRRHWAATW